MTIHKGTPFRENMGLMQFASITLAFFAIICYADARNAIDSQVVPESFYPPCPLNSPNDVTIYFPDLCDCNKYYMCYDGAAYQEECPPSLWWDETLDECVFPSNSVCKPASHPSCTAEPCNLSDPPILDPTDGCSFLMCVPLPTGGGNYYLSVKCNGAECFDPATNRCK